VVACRSQLFTSFGARGFASIYLTSSMFLASEIDSHALIPSQTSVSRFRESAQQDGTWNLLQEAHEALPTE
jgi:hypothetical protein